MVPRKIFTALQATLPWVTSPSSGSSSEMETGDCSAALLQVVEGDGGRALFLLGVSCLIFRKAQQNILVIDVTQVRLSKPDIWDSVVHVCMPIMPVRLPLHIKGTQFQVT